MKLIHLIVNSDDAPALQAALTKNGFFATKLSSTGGFLKVGNTTFMVGTDDEKVDRVIEIAKKYCSKRVQSVPNINTYSGEMSPMPVHVTVGGATIFVTNVERFEKL